MIENEEDLIKAIVSLVDNEKIRIKVKQSGKGFVICGVSALTGALLFGPFGLAVGGMAGGVCSYILERAGSPQPLGTVIKKGLSDQQKKNLAAHVINAVGGVLPYNISSGTIKTKVLTAVNEFMTKELKCKIAME